ncbi:mitochondrial fission process protein 1-like [Ctenocephalides felis]|uniref:mitochondrial fission process protein 1-like n=1 Tax=Ctenocephalides felis TaxID=7515 RepID=UPI000E6E2EC4|nr:mitochondrial fission process protein 1-like [Ctenocephalides felis]
MMEVRFLRNKRTMDNSKDNEIADQKLPPEPVLVSPENLPSGERDIFRDTYIRYLGYANELGEAFRPLVNSTVVTASYGVSTAYVLADTWDKAKKASKKPGSKSKDVIISAVDTLLWQGFASIIVPGYTINRITHYTSKFMRGSNFGKMAQIMPTAVGLLSIPLIIKPIDHSVDLAMDYTYRKIF